MLYTYSIGTASTLHVSIAGMMENGKQRYIVQKHSTYHQLVSRLHTVQKENNLQEI